MSGKRRVPITERKRTEVSCDKCKTRKQKCDRLLDQAQCRYCELHGITCTTTQPRKKRFIGSVEGPAGLGGRLVLLESLVKGLLPEAELSSNDDIRQEADILGIPLPRVDDDTYGDSEKTKVKIEDENSLPLLPDQQGQVQYIGPASSFSFHLKFRKLIQNYDSPFYLFGRNAAEEEDGDAEDEKGGKFGFSPPEDKLSQNGYVAQGSGLSDFNSPSDSVKEIDGQVLDTLIDAYFDSVNPDFPVLHESSFREAYESWCRTATVTDPAFLCSLLGVLILSRRVTTLSIPAEAERKWWGHIQKLLPTVFFTSNISAVQALMLTALHLHCTNHRDACWNLTGTAIRIAFAIGLHRDDIKSAHSPLSRELKKHLWWTLYGFEKLQVSSYNRPSAIDMNVSSVGCPNERLLGGHLPHEFMKWSQRLVVLLGAACRALDPSGGSSNAVEDAYSRPLSPAAGILRDLSRWKEALPAHLRLEVTDSLAPISQRQLLLLHAQFHYIVILISRSALVRKATILSKGNRDAISNILTTVSETCVESGQSLARILCKLESIGKYNSLTWWDVFLTVNASVVLGLESVCHLRQHNTMPSSDSLRELAALAERLLQSPRISPSNEKWASIVIEVSTVVKQFTAVSLPRGDNIQPSSLSTPEPDRALQASLSVSAREWELQNSITTGGCTFMTNSPNDTAGWNAAISMEDSGFARENASQFWAQFLDSNDQILNWD